MWRVKAGRGKISVDEEAIVGEYVWNADAAAAIQNAGGLARKLEKGALA